MRYHYIGNRFHNSTSDIKNRCVFRSMFPILRITGYSWHKMITRLRCGLYRNDDPYIRY